MRKNLTKQKLKLGDYAFGTMIKEAVHSNIAETLKLAGFDFFVIDMEHAAYSMPIRYAAPGRVPREVSEAAAQSGFYLARRPLMMEGRIELPRYFQQQNICNTSHRYGNLGDRAVL